MENISSEVSNSLSKFSTTTELTEADIEEVNKIKDLIKSAPQIVTEEMMDQLVKVASAQLSLITELTTKNISILDVVDAAFTAVSSKSSNSTVDLSEIKSKISSLTSSLTSSISNISDYIAESGSSILYSGDTFSIQLTDNSESSLSEARTKKLTIVGYDQCEKILKQAGVIAENESLYAQNIQFSSSIMSNSTSLSNSVTASNGITTVIVDSKGKTVNTTLCNTFTYKMPINNNVIDTNSQAELEQEIGVDVFNSSESFFNDKCYSYGKNGTDTTTTARRNKYNVSAGCSSGCKYNGTDEHGYLLCDCDETSEETYSSFKESVFNSILTSNIALFLCAGNVISTDVIYNAGFWAVTLFSSISLGVVIYHLITFSADKVLDIIISYDVCTITPDKVGNLDSNNINTHRINKKQTNQYDGIKLKRLKSSDLLVAKYSNISKISQNDKNQNSTNTINSLNLTNNTDVYSQNISNNINNSQNSKNLSSFNSPSSKINMVIPFKVGKKSVINNDFDINKEILANKSDIENKYFKNNDINVLNNVSNYQLDQTILNNSISNDDNIRVVNNLTKIVSLNREKNSAKTNSSSNIINKNESDHIIVKDIIDNNINIIEDDDVLKLPNAKTLKDLDELPIEIAVKIDKRSFWKFIWDDLKMSHPYLNLIFIKSIINPFIIRFLAIMFGISLECALNAMFFTDDYIDKQAEVKTTEGAEATGFIYTLINEFSKSLWPVVISNIFGFFTGLIIIVPKRYKLQLNTNLQQQNKDDKLASM